MKIHVILFIGHSCRINLYIREPCVWLSFCYGKGENKVTLAIIALVAIHLAREYTHYIHDTRRDKLISELTDKIKAKDFTEYKEMTTPAQTFEPVSKDDDEMYWMEIEEAKQ